jgi:hypothetical protein
VAQPVGGHRELDRHRRGVPVGDCARTGIAIGVVGDLEEPPTVGEYVVDQSGVDDAGEVVGPQHPLVVAHDLALGTVEQQYPGHALGAEGVHDPVVEVEERQMRVRDREVLVVTGVRDQRRPLRGFRRTRPDSWQVEPVTVGVRAGRARGVRVGRIRGAGDAGEADGGGGAGLELDPVGGVEASVLGVGGPAAIHGVQIQRRGAAVDQVVHGDVLA